MSNAYNFDFLKTEHLDASVVESQDEPQSLDVQDQLQPGSPGGLTTEELILQAQNKPDLEKQFDILNFLQKHREKGGLAPSVIYRSTGIDLEIEDKVAAMLQNNPKVNVERWPDPENPSLTVPHYSYQATFKNVRDRTTLLAQINREFNGVAMRDLLDSYQNVAEDIAALVTAGDIIAIANTEDKDKILFPRGEPFLVELDGLVGIPPPDEKAEGLDAETMPPPAAVYLVETDVDPTPQIRRGEAVQQNNLSTRVSRSISCRTATHLTGTISKKVFHCLSECVSIVATPPIKSCFITILKFEALSLYIISFMGVRQQTPPHDLLSHKLLIGEGRRHKSKNQAHISQQNSDFHTFLVRATWERALCIVSFESPIRRYNTMNYFLRVLALCLLAASDTKIVAVSALDREEHNVSNAQRDLRKGKGSQHEKRAVDVGGKMNGGKMGGSNSYKPPSGYKGSGKGYSEGKKFSKRDYLKDWRDYNAEPTTPTPPAPTPPAPTPPAPTPPVPTPSVPTPPAPTPPAPTPPSPPAPTPPAPTPPAPTPPAPPPPAPTPPAPTPPAPTPPVPTPPVPTPPGATESPTGIYPICFLCFDPFVEPTIPNTRLIIAGVPGNPTCFEIYLLGITNNLRPALCPTIRNAVQEACGCP